MVGNAGQASSSGSRNEPPGEPRSALERQLLEAFEAIPEGIAIFDAEDRYVLWNSRYAEMYSALTLRVGTSNTPALRLYERVGFRVEDEFLSSLRDDGRGGLFG